MVTLHCPCCKIVVESRGPDCVCVCHVCQLVMKPLPKCKCGGEIFPKDCQCKKCGIPRAEALPGEIPPKTFWENLDEAIKRFLCR